jgi:hypothetical protein
MGFNADFIASAIRSALFSPSLSAVEERLGATQLRASEVLAGLHVPHLPTRAEILHRALTMYAKTPSLDDIVDRAHAARSRRYQAGSRSGLKRPAPVLTPKQPRQSDRLLRLRLISLSIA